MVAGPAAERARTQLAAAIEAGRGEAR